MRKKTLCGLSVLLLALASFAVTAWAQQDPVPAEGLREAKQFQQTRDIDSYWSFQWNMQQLMANDNATKAEVETYLTQAAGLIEAANNSEGLPTP